jgi:indolepyruvate ferredoxin oxidoreductase beta subunit
MECKLVLAGLGGQGVVFLTRLLSRTAVSLGHQVMVSESHGMSQRGGAVVSHLQVGDQQAPLIQRGTANILIGLEFSEALRNLPFLRPGGKAYINSAHELPSEVLPHLDRLGIQARCLPASQMAMELGSAAVTNSIMAGYAHPFPIDRLRDTIAALAPGGRELNLQALDAGYRAAMSPQQIAGSS